MRLVYNGVVEQCVKVALFGGGGLIAVVEQVADDRHLGSVAAVAASADGAGGIGRTVLVAMQEDVPFDPSVRAVEIKLVIAAAGKDVVDELNDRPRSIAASEIDHVAVAKGCAEKVPEENAPPAALDATGAVQRFERRAGIREHAITDDKGSAVNVNVRRGRIAEREVIEIDRARRDLEAGCAA